MRIKFSFEATQFFITCGQQGVEPLLLCTDQVYQRLAIGLSRSGSERPSMDAVCHHRWENAAMETHIDTRES